MDNTASVVLKVTSAHLNLKTLFWTDLNDFFFW